MPQDTHARTHTHMHIHCIVSFLRSGQPEISDQEVAGMKRKLCAMCLMFNLLERWLHFALHSTGHKEKGVGAGRSFPSIPSVGVFHWEWSEAEGRGGVER